MLKQNRILLFTLCLSISFSFAQRFQIIEETNEKLVVEFELSSSSFSYTTFKDLPYIDFRQDFETTYSKTGSPALPFFSSSIELNNFYLEKFDYKIIQSEVFSNINVLPAPDQKRKIDTIHPLTEDSIIYSSDKFFPQDFITLSTEFSIREKKGQTIYFYPFQYNPISKKMVLISKIQITFLKKSKTNSHQNQKTNIDFIKSDFFINHRKEKYAYKIDNGEMLVLAPTSYTKNIQPLITWKNEKGIKTKLILLNDNQKNADSIKKIIVDYYIANPNVTYLLLVGDHDSIPTYSYGLIEGDIYWSDSYYGQLTNDLYPDLFVGRFSGNELEVQTMVDRTIEYEKSPLGGQWMNRAIGIGSSEGNGIGDNNEADWVHERNIRSNLLSTGYSSVYEFYDGTRGGNDANGNPSASDIQQAINDGVGFINYTGHGDSQIIYTSNFTNTNVQNLTNYGMYPFFVSVACNNGKFVSNKCLCEAFLSSTNQNKITGAIASVGSSILMDWAPPMKTQDEIVSLISNNTDITSLGSLFTNGQYSMLEKYGELGNGVMQTWIYFGDPSVEFRYLPTKEMSLEVSYDSIKQTIQINSPIENATVGISNKGKFLYTDKIKNGILTYSIPSELTADSLLVTLTKQNFESKQIKISTNTSNSKSNANDIYFYPNPTQEKLYIKNYDVVKSIEIINLSGEVVYQTNEISEVFDLQIDKGLYLISIQYSNGLIIQDKLLIQD